MERSAGLPGKDTEYAPVRVPLVRDWQERLGLSHTLSGRKGWSYGKQTETGDNQVTKSETSKRCITFKDARVGGMTVSGAILLDVGSQGYRIEVGIDGVERLALLCELTLKGRSKGQAQEEPILK